MRITLAVCKTVFLVVELRGYFLQNWEKLCFRKLLFISQKRSGEIADIKGKSKGKAIAVQAWTDPEAYSGLKLPDFKTIGT